MLGSTKEDEMAKVCHGIGCFLADWENTEESESLYLRALRGYEMAWGAEHISVLETANNLAMC
jgi:hypothetical protein